MRAKIQKTIAAATKSLKRIRLIAAFALIVFSCCNSTLAKADQISPLQRAINLSDRAPDAAATFLKTQSSPSAKAYLAYLYMSGKVKVAHSGKKIDLLMRQAIAKENGGLGEIEQTKHYHYASMQLLLRHMRFIMDGEGWPISIPATIFQEYPEEAFTAFAPYYGATGDAFLSIDLPNGDDCQTIPKVDALIKTLDLMCGSPSDGCSGTIRHMFFRQRYLAKIEVSVAPEQFVKDAKDQEVAIRYPQLERFLQTWANEELWNNQTLKELNRESKAAELPLASFYQKKFKWSKEESLHMAKAAIAGLKLSYLNNYSDQLVDTARSSIAYQIFSAKNQTLTEMQHQLGQKVLDNKDLALALKLAILNQADLSVINWLIEKGAPLTGGIEPPLFTAVLRPQVIAALIKAGADVNETNILGKTALIQAAQYNALETIKLLLEAGADVNHKMADSSSKAIENANLLCEMNYEIGKRTPLMYAVAFSQPEIIEYLIKNGAEKKARDQSGGRVDSFLDWNKRLSKADKIKIKQLLAG